jgi:hypothetical protein
MYAVFSIYYKHGEGDVKIVTNDDDMKKYCIELLQVYNYDNDDYGDYESDSLDTLISKTVERGKIHVENQYGWGVISIIKGDNLIEYS